MSTHACDNYSGTELDALSAAVNYHRWILEQFEPYLGESIVEVGAGIGSVSKLLLQCPIKSLLAFEPSKNMFPLLAKELCGETRAKAINDVFSRTHTAGPVDSVIYVNVLEHIEDDLAEVKNAYEALRPGGHLLVFVPALAWLYSNFDRHVGHYRRYTKRMLCDLAQKTGFTIVNSRYFDMVGILPWYVSFVLLNGRPKTSSVALYDKIVVPPMRIIERVISPPIGKNVLIIARKD